ncbi:hypothetical protein H6H01_34080 [Nostoc calcicola FACHB-3891]|nr:hypothetical protein [Nostoc calcicola FACHB-3891]
MGLPKVTFWLMVVTLVSLLLCAALTLITSIVSTPRVFPVSGIYLVAIALTLKSTQCHGISRI